MKNLFLRTLIYLCVDAAMSGIPTNKKLVNFKIDDPETKNYLNEVIFASGAIGIGIALVFGLIMLIGLVVHCIRCNRRDRRDRSVGIGPHSDNTKQPQRSFPYQNIGAYGRRQSIVLFAFTVLILMIYILCGAVAFGSVQQTKIIVDNTYEGINVFLVDLQNAICGINGAEQCEDGSVGNILSIVEEEVTRVFDSTEYAISSLGEINQLFLQVTENLLSMTSIQRRIEDLLPSVETSSSFCRTLQRVPIFARYDFEFNVPNISTSALTTFSTNSMAINLAAITAIAANLTAYDLLASSTSPLTSFSRQVDRIAGNENGNDDDYQELASQALHATMQTLRSITADIHKAQKSNFEQAGTKISKQYATIVLVISGIVLLPGLILFLSAICAFTCKSPKPFYANMAWDFVWQGIYCVVGGILLLLIKISGDICSQHKVLLELNFDQTVTVRGVTSAPLGTAFFNALEYNMHSSESANNITSLLDILDMNEILDASLLLQPVSDALKVQYSNVVAIFNSSILIGDALSFVNISGIDVKNGFDATAASSVIDARLLSLPPDPFDRDNANDILLFEAEYLDPTNGGVFQWVTPTSPPNSVQPLYKNALKTFSDILESMETEGYDPSPLVTPLTYSQVASIVSSSYYCGNDFADSNNDMIVDATNEGIYVYSGQDDDLCDAVTVLAAMTVVINDYEVLNAAFIVALNSLYPDIESLRSDVALLDQDIAYMTQSMSDAMSELSFIDTRSSNAAAELYSLADDIMNLNDVALGANAYAMCGFIGDFYINLFLESVCKDFRYNLRAIAVSLIFIACLMVVAFMLQGWLAPFLRVRPELTLIVTCPTPTVVAKDEVSKGQSFRYMNSEDAVLLQYYAKKEQL